MADSKNNKNPGKPPKKRNLSDKEKELLNNGLRILARIIARDIFEKNKHNPPER